MFSWCPQPHAAVLITFKMESGTTFQMQGKNTMLSAQPAETLKTTVKDASLIQLNRVLIIKIRLDCLDVNI